MFWKRSMNAKYCFYYCSYCVTLFNAIGNVLWRRRSAFSSMICLWVGAGGANKVFAPDNYVKETAKPNRYPIILLVYIHMYCTYVQTFYISVHFSLRVRTYILRKFHDEQWIIDNQFVQYNSLSLVINTIVSFRPWIGNNFTRIDINFKI